MIASNASLNRARTIEVLQLLARSAENKKGLVSETDDLVENQVPSGIERGSREHALFLFAIVPNDRGVKSSALWARAKQLFLEEPCIFDPAHFRTANLSNLSCDRLVELLTTQLKPRYANNAAAGWVKNATRLFHEYQSDARIVFAQGPTGESAYRAIRSFYGFGPKTGGMMYRAATGLGWASAELSEAVEIPVDTHDVRIALQTGILKTENKVTAASHQLFAPAVRRELSDGCRELDIPWFEIDRAMWLIGSRGCANKRCQECPLKTKCSVAQIDEVRPPPPKLDGI